ncbi:hypothetical protein ACRE_083560 [Hapsidospora chrysogenum ATCC 11550]|uniref:Rhodopsin domain-containing protein n=1 Tax=Hapsidospora chrysogenum (strain ATCC 11550 / CBS 779.69 / DSM 880 / IAM 14645 / JCM 23072 / IMI 49137) TaxID=857340 RepID=A0A086SV14_HAPC1|nr:hypothetical protein ACRE_083560 [Hapsidospora chrysogenum ATCC 11550]
MSALPDGTPGSKTIDPEYAAENNFPRMMAINGTFHVLAVILVGMRMYVRIFIVKAFGADDAMMIAALLFLFGGGMVPQIYAGINGALGRHYDVVSKEEMIVFGMMRFVQGVLMTVTSICLLKFSIGLSLLRLNSNKWYRIALWCLIIFVACYMIESWVSLLAFCDPVKAHWDRDAMKTAKCYPRELANTFAAMNTAFNIFTDVAFATIPIPMLWALHTKRRVRIYLIAIFNLGYITVGIGIVKLVYQQTTRGDPDISFNNWIQFYGLLQQNVGIVVACAPILKPLLAKALKLQTSNATAPSTQAGQYGIKSRTNPNAMGYARDMDDGEFEMSRYRGDYIHPKDERDLSTVVKGGSGSDEGSEINILPSYPHDKVLKQTEISVV